MSFFENNKMLSSIELLEKGLDVVSLRRKVLANNIANVDVPNFKKSDLSFEADLKRNFELQKKSEEEISLNISHPLHIKKHTYHTPNAIEPQIHTDYNSIMRNDGNNVDMEEEVNKLVKNQLQYSLFVDRLNSHFRNYNNLLRVV